MALNPVDKIAIIFTITFVDFMIVIIQLLSSEIPTNDRITIVGICGGIITFLGWNTYRKNPSTKQNVGLKDLHHLALFVAGIFLGLLIVYGIRIAYGINYQDTEPISFYYGIPLAIGGQAAFLFFTIMAMVVLVVRMPFIQRKIRGESKWVPLVEGVAFGFGVMAVYEFLFHGIPPLW